MGVAFADVARLLLSLMLGTNVAFWILALREAGYVTSPCARPAVNFLFPMLPL